MKLASEKEYRSLYTPSAWGEEYHAAPFDEVLGAGSAGPGKSLVLLHDPVPQIYVEHERCLDKHHPYYHPWGTSEGWALHLRRTMNRLDQTLDRAHRIFPQIDSGVRISGTTFTFSSGYKFQFDHCKDPGDWRNYYSQQYTHVAYDELVEFEWVQYENITSRCRTGDPVLRPMCRVRSMSNPLLADEGAEKVRVSNPAWVRDYFVQDAPEGRKVLRRKIIRPDGRVEYFTKFYLPATLYDNPDKEFVDDYELRLLSRSEYIRQALLYGNWYAQAGSYYGGDWNPNYHICSPFKIPLHWKRFRSMDWGFKSPGCVLWWAMDDDGNIFCEKELTFQYKPADKVAKMIREIEIGLGLWGGRKSKINGPADDQLWEERGDVGKTKAAVMAELGVPWVKADKRSRTTNGLRLLTRIRDHHDFQTTPGIVFFNSCKKCIQTIPSIGTDRNNKECPADGSEDHWHDATLYACAFASYGHKGIRSIPDDDDDDDDDYQPNTSPRSGNFGYWSH